MPKIYITSNTLFGYKKYFGFNKFLENSENYFNKELIPFLMNYSKPDDIFIHLGNMFSSKQNLNVKVIDSVQKIFSKISSILPTYIMIGENDIYSSDNKLNTLSIFKNIKNITIVEQSLKINDLVLIPYTKDINIELLKYDDIDYVFLNNNVKDIISINERFKLHKKLYSGYFNYNKIEHNYKNIGSPYQIDPDIKNCGIIVLDTVRNEDKFIPNKSGSKIETININNIDDFKNYDKEYFNKNIINVIINKELYENKEFKIKISEFNVKDVIIKNLENKKIDNDFDINEIANLFNIDELIINKINNNEQLKEEFNNILKIIEQ